MNRTEQGFATVQTNGVVTHVLVPVRDYERLTGTSAKALTPPSEQDIDAAIATFESPATVWHDANEVFQSLVLEGIEHVRRGSGLNQTELGKRVGLSQSQISRLESDPENATLGMLRKIAAALGGSRGAVKKGKKGKRAA